MRLGWNYEPTTSEHVGLFAGLAALLHAGGILRRWAGFRRMSEAGKKLAKRK
jgi:hypothetical protein